MKYLVINDPHIAVSAPSPRRTDNYEEACFAALHFVTQTAIERDANTIVCTGDWFHHKNPLTVPYRLTNRLVSWAKETTSKGIAIPTIIGNHDVMYQNTGIEFVKSQPVGALLSVEGVFLLDECHYTTEGWTFAGLSYQPAIQCPNGSWVEPELRPKHMILDPEHTTFITHNSLYPGEYPFPPFTEVEHHLKMGLAKYHHTGHIHEHLGTVKHYHKTLKQDIYWSNHGSLMFGALSEAELSRTPSVLLVDTFANTLEEIPIPSAPIEEIYDVNSYIKEKETKAQKASWTKLLIEELSNASKEETVESLIDKSQLDISGKELAKSLYNQATA